MSYHFVKLHIERPVKVPQLLDDLLVDLHVRPALGLAKAPRSAAALRLLQARETFRSVEIEVLVCNDAFESKEILHAAQLAGRVRDEPFAAHEVDLRDPEVLQPVFQVQDVHAYPDGVP